MPKSETSLNELLYDIRRIVEHREKLTIRKIEAIYHSLEKDLNAFIANVYVTYADEEGRLYISYLDAKNRRARFLQEIVENVDSISVPLKNQIMSLVEETYTKSYEGMLKAFEKAYSETEFEYVSKDIAVNPNVLKQALNNNISKLTLPAVMEIHRNEIIYQIQQELNIGLMQGDRYERMAKRISERVGVSRSKAMNIVRTETHRNVESGFMDCAERLQKGLDGSDLIYAATWRTMKDERVRPQIRRKTKKGWKTSFSKSGANHMKMEGVTVKAGELFNLGNGVKAKAPSKSGMAAHDCNCRCFLEYNLMTAEEFAKATGKSAAVGLTSGGESGKIKTSGALNHNSDEAYEHAEKYYEAVRKMKTDVKRISQNTGCSEELIQQIKDFIFIEEHDLGDNGIRRFYADYKMAQTWQRLIDGKNIQEHDMTLLKHEEMERNLMQQGYSQEEAHNITSETYNYAREAIKYYAEIEKHKKK